MRSACRTCGRLTPSLIAMWVLLGSCHSLDRQRPGDGDGRVGRADLGVGEGGLRDGARVDALAPDGWPAPDSGGDLPDGGAPDGVPDPPDVGPEPDAFQGECNPAVPSSCPAGLDCVAGNVCRCISGGRCAGCCVGDKACVAKPTAAQCGTAGAQCTACNTATANTCVAGVCKCGASAACAAPLECLSGSCQCPSPTELCDGVNNDCDAQVDEGCCPAGMTWSATLGFCYAGPYGPATWAAAQADCKAKGGCIGAPAALGQGLCGTWLVGNFTYPYYRCYDSPDSGSGAAFCSAGSSTTCGSCPSPMPGGCSQRYYCFSHPLLPKKLPCAGDLDCGRDQGCSGGSCVSLGSAGYCCEDTDCAGSCTRSTDTTGRCN